MRILLITGGGRDKRASAAEGLIRRQFPNVTVVKSDLRQVVKDYWVRKPNTKNKYHIGENGRANFAKFWQRVQNAKFEAIVSYDLALAKHLLPPDDAASMNKVDVAAGMIVRHKIPTLFIADPLLVYSRGRKVEERAASGFIASFHLKKLFNLLHGVSTNAKPIKFSIVTSQQDMARATEVARMSKMIAFDIETWAGCISVIGFACEVEGLDYCLVFVVPFLQNLDGQAGPYWEKDGLTYAAIKCVKDVLGAPCPKVAHNGAYDVSYLLKWGIVPHNYIYDTMLMMHATWPTVPRSLFMGASMFVERYRYWKADGKVVGDDGKAVWQVPRTAEATFRYWHYNGLDCANTLELCLGILEYWSGDARNLYPKPKFSLDWVYRNYARKFALEFGPCLYMSMLGIKVGKNRQQALAHQYERLGEKNLKKLRTLVDDPYLNPKSGPQVQNLLYDVLPITQGRKKRTTDKRYLKPLRDQNPLFARVIDYVAAAKEPLNNASKYGTLPMYKGRWLYMLKAAATTTARLASSRHNFNVGTNMQNVPKPARTMCVADEGRVLVSSDYSQSDSYFVAFESQDDHMMEVVCDDRDTHSVHVEFFFGHDYDKVVAGAAAKEKWVVDPVTGVRQIMKKVSHGTAYDMGGETMLLNVGRDAAISMIRAIIDGKHRIKFCKVMGLDETTPKYVISAAVSNWADAALAKACEFAQMLYYAQYPKMKSWKKSAVDQAILDKGVIHMYGGSTTLMLARPQDNKRYVPAAYGQGGTAGNINNAMLRLYYLSDSMWARGFQMHIQVHDELVCSVPIDDLELIERKVAIMEEPCTLHGRKFVVPVEAELSLSWSPYNTVVWKGLDNVDYTYYYNELAAEEHKVFNSLTSI